MKEHQNEMEYQAEDGFHFSSQDAGIHGSAPGKEGTQGDIGRWNNQVGGPINHQIFKGKFKRTSKERSIDK